MAGFPTGTVTFLFTDIEGSTRLLTRLRAGYVDVLAEHHRLLRAEFDEYGGREVHTEFFVAFARASDAIAAAVAVQRALACHGWPEGVEVRVRMGVHTGEATIQRGDYVGLDVHRAARMELDSARGTTALPPKQPRAYGASRLSLLVRGSGERDSTRA